MSSDRLLKESKALSSQRRPRSPRGIDANAAWLEKLIRLLSCCIRPNVQMCHPPRDQGGHCINQIKRCLSSMILSFECCRMEKNVLLVMYEVEVDVYQFSDETGIGSIVQRYW